MRLSDFFVPVLAYVKSFTPSSTTTAQNLSDKIVELIDRARLDALNAGFPLDSFENALFPVVAWADEHLSTTEVWSQSHTWQNFLLQRRSEELV
jgi:type VI secretion system protein ImpK